MIGIDDSRRPRLARIVGCHGIPDRCLAIGSIRMPICARCTGMFLGYACSPIAWLVLAGRTSMLLMGSLLFLPMVVDGVRQRLTRYWSTSGMRLATGWLGGIGQILALAGLGRSALSLL